MEKRFLVDQLVARLKQTADNARREGEAAAVEARDGASPSEKTVDARVALEYSNLARAQSKRAGRALDEMAALETFRPGRLATGAAIAVGAIVEVEDGDEGRTFFLAPAGAGVELTMP